VQDSSEIIDFCERAHPEPAVTPPPSSPQQRLAAYLIELLADEWMVVYGFWERWYYTLPQVQPNHGRFNAQQWGGFMLPHGSGEERLERARFVFQRGLAPEDESAGVYAGLRALGMTEKTQAAWEASNERLLDRLEAHFGAHDFALGGRPSLADFGLMGPLYAHLYRDAVPGFRMRTRHPLVAEWVERTNGTNALNARSYNQKLYSLGEDGALVSEPATSDGGEWLADDAIADTLIPVLEVFFDEMWPMLVSSMDALTRFVQSDAHGPGAELPGKTFTATPGFEELQTGEGSLTHFFEIGGVRERRMVVPYHAWMLQRIADVLRDTDRASVDGFLGQFKAGAELFQLDELLAGCRVRKQGGLLFSETRGPA
jgi:glutathione S-transferase